MDRGIGVVGTNHNFELAQNAATFFFVFTNHAQCAHTLSVEAEAFRKRGRYKEVQASRHKFLNHRAVLLDTVTKTLVGHV